jgi:hypothetical protein
MIFHDAVFIKEIDDCYKYLIGKAYTKEGVIDFVRSCGDLYSYGKNPGYIPYQGH